MSHVQSHRAEGILALIAAALLTACVTPERVAAPDEFPMHARIGDTDHHGGGELCLPLDEAGACPPSFTFYPERTGLVMATSTTSVVLAGDLRILAGTGSNDLILRPGARANASIITTADETEVTPVSYFELELDGSTHAVTGSVTSPLAETFDLWGNVRVTCSGEHVEVTTETGEPRSIRCDRE